MGVWTIPTCMILTCIIALKGNENVHSLTAGGWEWTDGHTPLSYLNWGPDNFDLFDCVEIRPESKGKWYDIGCDVESHYVCEKPKSKRSDPPQL